MKKNFLQDVVPPNHKRSLRDIPLPRSQGAQNKIVETRPVRLKEPEYDQATDESPVRTQPPAHTFDEKPEISMKQEFHSSFDKDPDEEKFVQEPVRPHFKNKKPKNTFMKKFVVVALIAAFVGIFTMISRTSAIVSITPKQGSYEVNTSIPLDASSTLAVQTQITKTSPLTVQATSEQQVSDKASGRIRIINNDSSAPQDLIKNTRFQTPEGLVYRIKDAIKIPGYTQSGTTIIPGTLEVDVYADEAGEKYNIGKTKFTIPGFSGTPQFDKITAESVSEMKGGYVGIKKVISDADKKKAEADLQTQVKNQFTAEAVESDSYVVVPNLSKITFSDLKDEVQGNSIVLTLTATADAFSFKKQDFYNYIGQSTIIGATKTDSFSLNLKGLQFSIDAGVLNVRGATDIKWVTDVEALKNDLVGKKKSEVSQVVNTYRSFEKADIDLKPFWKTKFPTDTSKINIQINE